MKRTFQQASRLAVPVALAVLGLGSAAIAGPYPGSLVTFTNGAGNTQALFTISADMMTITVTGDKTTTNKYFIDGKQLLDFRSLYLVNPADGSATIGVSTTTNGGSVTDGITTPVTWKGYNNDPLNLAANKLGGYTGYDDGANRTKGKGFPTGSPFLVVANPTASNNDTFGSFTFDKSVAGYDIGLDYNVLDPSTQTGTATARGYFQIPATPVTAVPEPAPLVSLAVGGFGLAGLMLRARKRPAKAA